MDDTSKRQEMTNRLMDARDALREIERRRSWRRAELLEVLEATLKAEFSQAIAAAAKREDEITAEIAAFDREQAKAVAAGLKPRNFRYYSNSRWSSQLKLTDTYGVEEIITADSEHPGNAASYSRADIGERVIRILKADGTPSKRYERFRGDSIPSGWKLVEEAKVAE